MKKILTFLLTTVISFTVVSQSITIPDLTLSGTDFGNTVNVPLNVNSLPDDIMAITILITYNPDVLEYFGFTNEQDLSGYDVVYYINEYISGELSIDIYDGVGLNLFDVVDGKLLDLQFTFNGGETSLSFTHSDYMDEFANELSIPFTSGSASGFATITNDGGSWTDKLDWVGEFGSLLEPGPGHNSVIAPGAVVTLGAAGTVNSVTIQDGGQLTQSSGTLTVTTDFTIEDGGSFLQQGTLDVAGTTSMDKEIAAYSSQGWSYLSSPVSAQAIDPGFIGAAGSYDFFRYDEPAQIWRAFEFGNWGPNTNFVPGESYLVGYNALSTKTFTGSFNSANTDVAVTKTNAGFEFARGFNLIGNPFPSALTWNATTWNTTNVQSNAYVWDNGTGEYVTFAADEVLNPTEGIMIYTDANETITIPATSRVHPSVGPGKSTISEIVLAAIDTETGYAQSSKVRFHPNASESYDLAYDAKFLQGNAPVFYSNADNHRLMLNTLPAFSNDLVIPFSFEKNDANAYTIQLQGTIGNATIYLTDTKTNTTVLLSEVQEYFFTAEAGDESERFLLHFTDMLGNTEFNAALPQAYSYGETLVTNDVQQITKVELYNTLGQMVESFSTNGIGQEQHLLNLPSGTYYVRMQNNSQVVSHKVFLQQ